MSFRQSSAQLSQREQNVLSPLPPNSSMSKRRFSVDHDRVMTPSTFDPSKYSVIKQLGRGSFGSCKLMKLCSDNTLHAVKSIKHSTPAEKHSAKKEIDLMLSLRHPFIVMVEDLFYGEGGIDENVHIVMSYCDGGDLGKLIKSGQRARAIADENQSKGPIYPYTGTDVLKWFGQICLGMDYLHSNGVLHRDIKAANIFLYESKQYVRIGDFGLAKILSPPNFDCLTEVGTAFYMSPEILHNRGYSFPSDVWSLGCVLYELLCLENPFIGADNVELVKHIGFGEPPCKNPIIDCHKELWAIVKDMLKKDPKERITIQQIINVPLMKRVNQSVIAKYKPDSIPGRQRRDEFKALQHQYEQVLEKAGAAKEEMLAAGSKSGGGKRHQRQEQQQPQPQPQPQPQLLPQQPRPSIQPLPPQQPQPPQQQLQLQQSKKRKLSLFELATRFTSDAIEVAMVQVGLASTSRSSPISSSSHETPIASGLLSDRKANIRLLDALDFSKDEGYNTSLDNLQGPLLPETLNFTDLIISKPLSQMDSSNSAVSATSGSSSDIPSQYANGGLVSTFPKKISSRSNSASNLSLKEDFSELSEMDGGCDPVFPFRPIG